MLWVDIENAPQVQYLLPLVRAWRARGLETVVTARDYGETYQLLDDRGEPFHAVGAAYGASKAAKAVGLVRRTRALVSFMRRSGVPAVLVCASRAAVLAARRLRVRSFVIDDYEHANTSLYRITNCTVFFPDVIDPGAFRVRGIAPDRLAPFRGLKEDLTFAGVDLAAVEPARLDGEPSSEVVRVLFRPPAEESHYYNDESRKLALDVLRHLAGQPNTVVVFSPRYPWQAAYLDGIEWRHEPVLLTRPLPFVSLLKAVDLVVCSGGTMLREAAYLGVPAYSVFRSEIGAVDRYLESIGRAFVLDSAADVKRIRLEKRGALEPLRLNPGLVDELAGTLSAAAGSR
jgi:predicted glycosyltransferase